MLLAVSFSLPCAHVVGDSQLSERDYVPGTGTSTVGSLLTVAMTLLAFRFVLCGSFAILMS